MVNEIQECQMLFEHRTEMDKCIVLHQHFYQIIHEKTFLMRFDESHQNLTRFDQITFWQEVKKICSKSRNQTVLKIKIPIFQNFLDKIFPNFWCFNFWVLSFIIFKIRITVNTLTLRLNNIIFCAAWWKNVIERQTPSVLEMSDIERN